MQLRIKNKVRQDLEERGFAVLDKVYSENELALILHSMRRHSRGEMIVFFYRERLDPFQKMLFITSN